MFIPLHDDNPLRDIAAPYVTRGLIAVTVASFVLFQSGLVIDAIRASAIGFGVVPAAFNHSLARAAALPEPLTLVSYLFVHGGWMHLVGNMLFLWVFGDNVEDALGHGRFLGFYLACGIVAALTQASMLPTSETPLIGASGAVAGVVVGYLMLHPRVKIWVLVMGRIPLKIAAVWVISAWIVFQVASLWLSSNDQTAWWAHIGGMATGAVLLPFMRQPGVPLFDRGLEG